MLIIGSRGGGVMGSGEGKGAWGTLVYARARREGGGCGQGGQGGSPQSWTAIHRGCRGGSAASTTTKAVTTCALHPCVPARCVARAVCSGAMCRARNAQ
eukprot:1300638-Rhodomonas_salina.1